MSPIPEKIIVSTISNPQKRKHFILSSILNIMLYIHPCPIDHVKRPLDYRTSVISTCSIALLMQRNTVRRNGTLTIQYLMNILTIRRSSAVSDGVIGK